MAEYLHILRNATHGRGSRFPEKAARIRAYLARHTGAIPHDLPLLAYLYLLDVLTRPQVLAQALRTGKT